LECLELGGNYEWYNNTLLNKDMFLKMSSFNLKKVSLGNLKMLDDAAIIILCDNIIRLEEFSIERGEEDSSTTHVSIAYLIKKFSGSLTHFFDESHEYSAAHTQNISLALDHIIEVVLRFDCSDESLTQEIIEMSFKETSTSNGLKSIRIDNCESCITQSRMYSQFSFWDSKEPKLC
jgi:hypothetical protein